MLFIGGKVIGSIPNINTLTCSFSLGSKKLFVEKSIKKSVLIQICIVTKYN